MNRRRVERKLPLLITDAPWYSCELDRNEYRVSKFRQREPQKFNAHVSGVIAGLEKLKHDIDVMFPPKKGNNRK